MARGQDCHGVEAKENEGKFNVIGAVGRYNSFLIYFFTASLHHRQPITREKERDSLARLARSGSPGQNGQRSDAKSVKKTAGF